MSVFLSFKSQGALKPSYGKALTLNSTLEFGMYDSLPNRNHLNPLNPSGFKLNLLIFHKLIVWN